MTQPRHHARYWLRRRRAALDTLANVKATNEQRHHARCRLNRAVDVLARLVAVPPMRRELEIDRLADKARARTAS